MSGSNEIIVHAVIINKIIRAQHQKRENRTAPLIRDNLHSHNKNATKLIEFLEKQLDKYGHASSCASDFDTLQTLSNLTKDALFEGIALDNRLDTEKTKIGLENQFETQYRRYMAIITFALDHHVYSMPATTGDHVPIILYEKNDNFFLYIALLNVQDDITIEEKTGEILGTTSLNSSTFKIALKINLNDMLDHYERLKNSSIQEEIKTYVWWVQKGNEQIPQYIQNFIPVKYKIDDVKTTKNLMLTLRGYLDTTEFNSSDRDLIDKLVSSLLTDKAERKEAVNIVSDIDPIIIQIALQRSIDLSLNSFKDYRDANLIKDEMIGNVFYPDKTTMKGLAQLKFDINVAGNAPIKIFGMRSHAGNTIELNDSDSSNPYLQIKVEPRDVEGIKQKLNQGKLNESEESED